MQSMREILKSSSLPQGSKAPKQEPELKNPVPSNIIKERGISYKVEPPIPERCKFCGAELFYTGLIVMGTVFMWSPTPQRCTCEQAKAYWKQHDEDEARKKKEIEEKEAMERRRQKIEHLLGKSGIKKRFQQRTFENFVQNTPERRRCFQTAKNYADKFPTYAEHGEGLYIEGSNGTGKTHLAAAIALQLISEGVPVVCKTAGDLLADIKKAYDRGEASEYDILRAYKTVDLLIVDDLGKEQCTDWSVSTLYSILNDRYEDMKPTIITTNFNTDSLTQAETPKGYDGTKIRAIISRLREVSNVITMAWEDYRSQ